MKFTPAFSALVLSAVLMASSRAAPSALHVELDVEFSTDVTGGDGDGVAVITRVIQFQNSTGPDNLHPPTPMPLATFENCQPGQVDSINMAVDFAKRYVDNAIAALNTAGAGTSARYKTWFGAPNGLRLNTVKRIYADIKFNDMAQWKFICKPQCPINPPQPGWHIEAHVDHDVYGVVSLCPPFFQLPFAGAHSQASALVHEASHFDKNGFAKDDAYGFADCEAWAKENPQWAINNAGNIEFFASNPNEDKPRIGAGYDSPGAGRAQNVLGY
ncbi:hypothetical protein BD413DRAFT_210138 [Trametes elegans]|nr:hypothetical protein BD413DRAFT_210138 [Trametes elegans]